MTDSFFTVDFMADSFWWNMPHSSFQTTYHVIMLREVSTLQTQIIFTKFKNTPLTKQGQIWPGFPGMALYNEIWSSVLSHSTNS